MTVLNGVRSAARDVADLTTGLGSIATAPASDSKTVVGETKKYTKQAYGTLMDGFFIVPSVGMAYLLLNPPEESDDSVFFRFGKAAFAGTAAYVLVFTLRAFGGVV